MPNSPLERVPCWVARDCSKFVYTRCPAYLHPEKPCWENGCTQSETLTGIPKNCEYCKFFRLYGPHNLIGSGPKNEDPISPSPRRGEGKGKGSGACEACAGQGIV